MLHQLANGLELSFALALSEQEDLALSFVQQRLQASGLLAGQILNFATHRGQSPSNRLVLNDPGVLSRVAGDWHHLVQTHQVWGTSDGSELTARLQLFAEGEV